MLSGKYLNGARPAGARWSLQQRMGLFRDTDNANAAVAAYCEVAKDHGYTPSQLALAWCDKVDGVTSTIIGATKLEQLKEDIDAFAKPLSDQAWTDVMDVFKRYPLPF